MKSLILNEISIKYTKQLAINKKITGSNKAYEVAKSIYNLTGSNMDLKEYFFVIYLNRANEIIGYYKLSEGGISGTLLI